MQTAESNSRDDANPRRSSRYAKWLILAAIVQIMVVVIIVRSWPGSGPREENLARLGSEYVVVNDDGIGCGNGGTAECGWTFVVEHGGSEADLVDELDRVGISPVNIDQAGQGLSEVRTSWIIRDPSVWSVLAVVALLVGAVVSALGGIGMVLFALVTRR